MHNTEQEAACAGLQCKADIARLSKFSIRTIDALMAKKKIPFIKIGRSVRFRWPAVEAALLRFERKEIR